jgi:F0F1-type ATP synthase epsilon subunit
MPKKTKKPDVVISISGGIIEVEKKPQGVSILVKDYDIQEHTSETKKDKYGSYRPYFYQEH